MRKMTLLLCAILMGTQVISLMPAPSFAQSQGGSDDDDDDDPPPTKKKGRRGGGGGEKWGAVARHEGSFYGVWAYDSESEAKSAAIKNCEKEHGKGKCYFTVISANQCWALARAVPDRGGWGQAVGEDLKEAVKVAMKNCKDGADKCKKSFTFCADGSNMFNDR